ncbi:MAG: hypothetical protein A2Y34_05865 [Spirochaetes bacterium GWC1_27_15]|nr:MAG: hypothetical protein A2Z98_09175 [Spirochaetes bacterium GWB1_27_13]OHD24797.1 MAG: hypothetical protein A2Y34_05865 [Spirochaetes bacterium GWC1_27_15]
MIINVILFIPYITYKIFQIPYLYAIVSNFLNLNINHPNNFYSINDGAYWQILSAMFMHGGIFHIIFNMYALYIFGKPLINKWGGTKFLLFYLTTGILANIASVFIFMQSNNPISLLGASGAIYAVLLAFVTYYPDIKLYFFALLPIKAKWAILLFTGIELFSELTNFNDGIAHITHLFGFLFGFFYLLFFFRINAIQKIFFPSEEDKYIIR